MKGRSSAAAAAALFSCLALRSVGVADGFSASTPPPNAVVPTKQVPTTSSVAPRLPRIIQGGMGIRISSWKMARAVARTGELGIVSGTVIDTVFVRELQNGDPTGDVRRALEAFPDQTMVKRIMDKFFVEGGKDPSKPFRSVPMWTVDPSQLLMEVTVMANFVEIWLAKHNEDGSPVMVTKEDGSVVPGMAGINLLTKVPLPTIASLYGAMLAGCDYVIMGAGIPLQVPGVLDSLVEGKLATFPIEVAGDKDNKFPSITFDPVDFWTAAGNPDMAGALQLERPKFLPIVSSVVLAKSFLKRANGRGPTKGVDGFVIELPSAGGHNAPPRGFRYDPVAKSHAVDLNAKGEPVYGPKDEVDLIKFLAASKGLPFYLAGSYAHKDKLSSILELGGQGVQVGSMFSLCDESGMEDAARQSILSQIAQRDLEVFTDPVASPTGYPFKVLELGGSLSDKPVYEGRDRICNLGYLRTPYLDEKTNKVGYRCPAEPVDEWLKKGGEMEAIVGRKCLCNALMANVGLPQTRKVKNQETGEKETYVEEQLITVGDEVNFVRRFMKQDQDTGRWSFKAADVVEYLKTAINAYETKEEASTLQEAA